MIGLSFIAMMLAMTDGGQLLPRSSVRYAVYVLFGDESKNVRCFIRLQLPNKRFQCILGQSKQRAIQMTENSKTFVGKLIQELKQQRDELRLQMHLGSQDAKDEWLRIEDKLAQLSQQYQPLRDAVEESSSDVWEALKLLGSEVSDGFSRIRKSL